MNKALRAGYRDARKIAARHGRTYFLATRLMPAAKRPAIHALYAFARYADDLVDHVDAASTETVAQRLNDFQAMLNGSDGPRFLIAVRDTISGFDIDLALFDAFFASMRMDLTVTSYSDRSALSEYMYGSAEVIGLQLLPILGAEHGESAAAAHAARALGTAFQLTNFIRDVGEDLDRGRVYLPMSDLDRFGVTIEALQQRVVDDRVKALLAYEIDWARQLYDVAAVGIGLLDPTSRECVSAAWRLYGEILTEVERADYQVLDRRVSVGTGRRLAVFASALGRSRLKRRPSHDHQLNVWTTNANPNSRSSTGA